MAKRSDFTTLTGGALLALALGGFALSAWAAPAPLANVRLADGVQRESAYTAPATRYVAAAPSALYQTTSVTGPTTTEKVVRGQMVEALAEALDGHWILVGKGGVGVGYIPRARLCPVAFCQPG